MAKKKIDKEAERTPSSPGKIVSIFKNETVHFVLGLMLVIFSVYLLLAFSSFFFTGRPTKVLSTAAARQTLRRLIIM